MIKVYAALLVLGVVALVAWVMATVFAGNVDRPALDPEARFGLPGRRLVAGLVGFGMAGMSAEYSPLDLPWPLGLVLAAVGAVAAAWYAGTVGSEPGEPA